MSPAEEPAAKPQDDRSISGLPADTRVLFANEKGVYTRHNEVRRTALLAKMAFLRKFLQEGERVLFVATAHSPAILRAGKATGAGWCDVTRRAVLVFTDRRFFHVPTTWRYEYKGSVAHAWYGDCRSIRVKGSTLVVEYRSGTQEKFPGLFRADRPQILQLPTIVESSAPADNADGPGAPRERHHLCPKCTQVLTAGVWTCPSCGLAFKSDKETTLQTLAIPGGGYFYTNHWAMGVAFATVECYLMILMLVGGLQFVRGSQNAAWLLGVAAFILLVMKLHSLLHAHLSVAQFIPCRVKSLRAEMQAPAAAAPAPQAVPQESPEEPVAVR
jgi:hypothetical protein